MEMITLSLHSRVPAFFLVSPFFQAEKSPEKRMQTYKKDSRQMERLVKWLKNSGVNVQSAAQT